jgi:hypothetical protein
VRCTVQGAASQSGTWLVRAECSPDDPSDPATVALLTALMAGSDGVAIHA